MMPSEQGLPYSWEQLSLIPEPVVEMTMRVGLVPDGNHAQIQYECRDATRGELVALYARPHVDLSRLEELLPALLADFGALVVRYSGPFADR